MQRSQRFLIFVLLVAALGIVIPRTAQAAPPTRVAYTVAVADIPNKTYRVTVRAEGVTDPTVRFAIPAWTPGWYVLRDYYRNISNVTAAGTGQASLLVRPIDQRTWQVTTGGARSVTLSYNLKATDRNFGFFEPYLDARNGFVPGPSSLMYVVDGTRAPCSITYRVPEGWKIASANTPTDRPSTFTAPDYDTLADQPADLGRFARYERTVSGVPVSVVLVGAEGQEHKPFTDKVFRISEAGVKLLGKPPFPRYIYHFRFGQQDGAIGLEHLNSTVISLPPSALRSSGYLSLIAHEFVHAWNVKRIRPEALGPFDYARAVRVKDLWWAEGVTEYYAPRVMVAAGLFNRSAWYGYFNENLYELQNNPARRKVTLEEASLKVWEGDESQGLGGLSYYNKGMIVGLLLDIEMRARTENRIGLDEMMAYLLRESERTGKGFAPGGLEAAASKLTETDMKPFFDRALRSTEELPLAETLAKAGLVLRESVTATPALGIRWNMDNPRDGFRIESVEADSAAEEAGLEAGDVVTAIAGVRVAALRGSILGGKRPGDRVALTIRRGGNSAPATIQMRVGRREERSYRLGPTANATTLQQAIRAAVMGEFSPLPPAPSPALRGEGEKEIVITVAGSWGVGSSGSPSPAARGRGRGGGG